MEEKRKLELAGRLAEVKIAKAAKKAKAEADRVAAVARADALAPQEQEEQRRCNAIVAARVLEKKREREVAVMVQADLPREVPAHVNWQMNDESSSRSGDHGA